MIIRCERGLSGSRAAVAPPACCECNGGNFCLPDVGLRFDTSAGCFGFQNSFLFGFKIKIKKTEEGIVELLFRLCYCYVTTDDHNNTPSPLANVSINTRLKFVNCDEGHISLFLSFGACVLVCTCCACACVCLRSLGRSASPFLFSLLYSCSFVNVASLLCFFCWLWSAFAFAGVSEFLTASCECVF